MLNIKRRYFALAGAVAVAGGLALAVAPAAQATTADCQAAYGNACGTFSSVDKESPTPATVFMDLRASVQANGVVIGYSANSAADQATDWTRVQHKGHVNGVGLSDQNTISYSFVLTPHGQWTSKCLADPNDGTGLTIRPCNELQWQRFFADRNPSSPQQIAGTSGFNGESVFGNGNQYALQNAASRQFLADTATVPPGVRPAGADTRQLVTDTAGVIFTANEIWAWLP